MFRTIVAFFGLVSFALMFVGTALAIVIVGFTFAFKVFIASLIVFLFCLFLEKGL
jgi:hypothetical protein